MKAPTTVKEVRRFLGICGFYIKHVPSFAKIASPLTNLTRAHTIFKLTDNYCQQAFEALRERLNQAPILVKAQVEHQFILTTYASDTHVSAVLSQVQIDGKNWKNKPVGHFSKKLNSCESRYSATDKEALAVVLECQHYHHYLWGNKFSIVIDHQPLTTIFKRKTKSPRMNRRIQEMREYDYSVQYLNGKENHVADHLSGPVQLVV